MKRSIGRYFPASYQFLVLSLVLLMGMGTIFRAILFFQNIDLASDADWKDILYGLFNRGLLFDLNISLIILLVPFLTISILYLSKNNSVTVMMACTLFTAVAGVIHLAVSATDLGFFSFYNSRITSAVFNWTDHPGLMFRVSVQESSNLFLFLLFLVSAASYAWIQSRIFRWWKRQTAYVFRPVFRILIFSVSAFLFLSGIRGSFNLNNPPLVYKDAFFSDDHFLNQLGFNPVYHLSLSFLNDTRINYFKSEEEFINTALSHLERRRSSLANPFEMEVGEKDNRRPNIILVFLESMSNAMVSRYDPGLRTTPCLDSLAEHGIVFDNFFAAGIHTHNAIFSTLYGLPAVMNLTPMNSLATSGQVFHGMPWILKEKGYRTAFYITGSKDFDNMDRFLSLNGFDRVIGEEDYAPGAIYNHWGATDKTMFDRVLEDCDSLSGMGRPFFCSILTISSHKGYAVPPSLEARISNTEYPLMLYEYADLQLQDFMDSASKTGWFDNTVFVMVGDHGQNFGPVYDMNLNYHRVPLIIYSPSRFGHLAYEDPGQQEDIYPTLFGLLGFHYKNNGTGMDLFGQKRDFAFFSADNKLGVIDDSLFLVYRGKDNISLYAHRDGSIEDVRGKYPGEAELMLDYGFSMVQSANYLIEKELTSNTPSMEERYEVNRFIAHAGGMIDGHAYTNSLEALDFSYRIGFRLIELDILKTSDGRFVAAHDWDSWKKMAGFRGDLPPSHQDFMLHQLFGKYTPLDMEGINAWFAGHPDATLVTDKINEPGEFSASFVDKARLMMELFSLAAVREGQRAGIRSAMPGWSVLGEISGDKAETLKEMGITDVAASRRVLDDNLTLLVRLKESGIRVYVYHVNQDRGIDEHYVLCNDMDYVYGMYADKFDFGEKIDCP